MREREEALKLLLEANITQDLKDIEMVNRLVAVIEPIINERNELRKAKEEAEKYSARINEMKDSIKKLLDGEQVEEWM